MKRYTWCVDSKANRGSSRTSCRPWPPESSTTHTREYWYCHSAAADSATFLELCSQQFSGGYYAISVWYSLERQVADLQRERERESRAE